MAGARARLALVTGGTSGIGLSVAKVSAQNKAGKEGPTIALLFACCGADAGKQGLRGGDQWPRRGARRGRSSRAGVQGCRGG